MAGVEEGWLALPQDAGWTRDVLDTWNDFRGRRPSPAHLPIHATAPPTCPQAAVVNGLLLLRQACGLITEEQVQQVRVNHLHREREGVGWGPWTMGEDSGHDCSSHSLVSFNRTLWMTLLYHHTLHIGSVIILPFLREGDVGRDQVATSSRLAPLTSLLAPAVLYQDRYTLPSSAVVARILLPDEQVDIPGPPPGRCCAP